MPLTGDNSTIVAFLLESLHLCFTHKAQDVYA